MKTLTLLVVFLVWTSAAHAYSPDPAPNAEPGPIVYGSYDYSVPAIAKHDSYAFHVQKGDRIPGWFFRCHVPATRYGKPNLAGHRHCVIFKR